MPDHAPFDIFDRAADFLAGIEYAQRIEYLLYLREKLADFRAEHHRKIRRADDAVVVFAGVRAMVLGDELIYLGLEFEDLRAGFGLAEIQKRDDMEITVADVPGDGIEHVVLREDRV